MSRRRRRTPAVESFAAQPPSLPRDDQPGGVGRILPQTWSEFEVGPYKALPSDREAVMDGYLMQRYDPTIGAALTIIKQLICSKLGDYSHEDERVEQFVQEAINGIMGGRRRLVASLLSCLWAGFAIGEKIWATDGPWRIARIDLLHPLTFWDKYESDPEKQCGIQYDKAAGRVAEVKQMRWSQMTDEIITWPLDQVVYWPFWQELREEVVGKRLTDRARRNWFMRAKIEAYWDVFLKRFAHPTPVFQVPKGTQQDSKGQEISNSQYYSEFIQQLAPGNGLAIEAGPEDKFDFQLLEASSNSNAAYIEATRYHNAEMFKSMLMSPVLLEEPQHASRAQTGEVLDLFVSLIEAIRSELGEILVEQIAWPMVGYNFGATLPPGEWQFQPLENDDLEMLSRVLLQLKQAGAVQFSESDERGVREKFSETGLVPLDEIQPKERAAAQEAARQAPLGFLT